MTSQASTDNALRAGRAGRALENYKQAFLGESGPVDESTLADLLADLRHWAAASAVDFQEAVDDSAGYYEEETLPNADDPEQANPVILEPVVSDTGSNDL